ncbi:lysyl tRNA synthetase [Salmonella enterica subsp. enterica]|uniref:Lysyl tRNA synthetase n=1 Tax=Salmonella enterica I TaxID=59201 RepID=A0A379W301_SALET|nr:lysyl tRNA synthetase [Salmonella enterica subsp. enterica]
MSEQNAQGADEVVDLNNEMKARRGEAGCTA